MAIITIQKDLGETMGQLLVRVKQEQNISDDVSVTYCGRLDPAAMGECLFLSGEDVYKKEEYLKRDKKYRAEILIGISTDTGDLLGKVTTEILSAFPPLSKGGGLRSKTEERIKELIGTHQQQPHPFSSFRIEGKPLWEHTKNNNEVEVPIKERIVYDVKLISEKEISYEQVLERVKFLCSTVEGDFRQDEILTSWLSCPPLLGGSASAGSEGRGEVLEIEFHVSSGTFIRSLVETFSEKVGIPCCLFSLERTTC